MPAQTKAQKKRLALRRVIRRAIERELTKMADEPGDKINDWNPDALASWITPGVIVSVERALRS